MGGSVSGCPLAWAGALLVAVVLGAYRASGGAPPTVAATVIGLLAIVVALAVAELRRPQSPAQPAPGPA